MSNATRWYTTREAVKAAAGLAGSALNALIDGYIEAASADIEKAFGRRRFIPETATKQYSWPPVDQAYEAHVLELDEDLLAVTSLTTEGDDETEIAATDFFLGPANRTPKRRIEIDQASAAVFQGKDTPQRALRVTGRWAYSEDTRAAGTVASGLSASASATSMVCSDASQLGVGDTLLVESEQLFISERGAADVAADLAGNLTADSSETTVPVDDGTKVHAGEVIQIDSERMLVEAVIGNNLTVMRAYDASVRAAHSSGADVYAFRALTVVRGVNGTTAATHADAAAIAKYAPPGDIVRLCTAEALAAFEQGKSGWTGAIGGDESGTVETRMFSLRTMRRDAAANYRRLVIA